MHTMPKVQVNSKGACHITGILRNAIPKKKHYEIF